MNTATSNPITKILIRPMQEEDLPAVQEIDRISFSMPWPANAYHYELKENPGSMLWVAESTELDPLETASAADTANLISEIGEKRLIGMIVVWFIIDEAHIATIAVHPDYRSRGVAKKLLYTAMQAIIRKGFEVATLEVRANNIHAQNLYRRFGFEIISRRPRYYRDNNEDAFIMTVEGLKDERLISGLVEMRADTRHPADTEPPRD